MKFPSMLRVAIVSQMGIFEINTTEKNDIQITGGWESEFLQILADGLKFRYTAVIPKENEWGRPLDNGSWTGMIGMVARNEADIAIGNIGLYLKRLSAVDFAYPYHIEDFIFATKPPGLLSRENAIYLPFSVPLWMALFFMMITLTIAFKLLLIQRYTFQDIVFYILGSLFFAHWNIKPKATRETVLTAFWLFGSMILSFSYRGLILAFLTIPLKERPVTNKHELLEAVRKGTHKCVAQDSGFMINLLLNSGDKTVVSLGKEIEKNNWLILATKKGIKDSLSQDRVALITSRSACLDIQEKVLSKDVFFSTLTGIAVNKNFCCKKSIDLIIHRMTAAGLYIKSKDFFFFKSLLESRENLAHEPDGFVPLRMQYLYGAFILLFAGNILAILCFIIEFISKII